MQFDWEQDKEHEKERRLQERRQRVQERLAAQKQKQQGAAGGEGGGGDGAAGQARGKHEAALAAEAVRQLREQCDAAAAAVREAAEAREDEQREAWEQQGAWLKGEIATEAESCRQHNRAIDLEWEGVHNATTPQAAHDAMLAVRAHCDQVLQSKDALIDGIHAVLRERDEAYMRLLHRQAEETDGLVALLAGEYDRFRRGTEQALEAVEAAYLQERSELISAHKAELDGLLEKRSALEQGFMDQYLKACESYETQLEAMRAEEAEEYAVLKRRLEGEVASLEAHLDGMRSVYMLNADKLEYNVRVLSERERENKEALQQQKRKLTRQWEVLSRLKKRYLALDRRFTEENQRLADEYQRVTRAFNHLQTKYRRFKAADLARFGQIRAMKEEELDELVEQLAEVDAVIRQHVLGLPPAVAAEGLASSEASEAADPGLAVVGRRVTASAEEGPPAAGAGVESAEPEVLVLSSEDAAQRGQLIAAYRPGAEEAGPGGAGTSTAQLAAQPQAQLEAGASAAATAVAALPLPPVARQELRESLEAGVLSLLLDGGGRVDGAKTLRLLQQLSEAAPGRWEAACVARGLGMQHGATGQALEELLTASAASGAEGSAAAAGSRAALVSAELVQQALQRLVAEVQGGEDSADASTAAPRSGEPTASAYWSQRAEGVLPAEVFQTWALLEPQLARQFKLLKARSKAADEVAALARENEALKARLTGLLTSPANDELQLPTRLLLQ